jgi:ATP-binding cassette subfamily F protein 3
MLSLLCHDAVFILPSDLLTITRLFRTFCIAQAEFRSHLGRYEITGNDAVKPMKFVSGGQKSRVAFACLTYSKPHVVILDEPTNHLGTYEGLSFIPTADVHDDMLLSYGSFYVAVSNRCCMLFSDMGAIEALADALKAYNGGVLVVSHDQHFITSVCNELWVIQNRKVTVFDGTFMDYKKSVVARIRNKDKKK